MGIVGYLLFAVIVGGCFTLYRYIKFNNYKKRGVRVMAQVYKLVMDTEHKTEYISALFAAATIDGSEKKFSISLFKEYKAGAFKEGYLVEVIYKQSDNTAILVSDYNHSKE